MKMTVLILTCLIVVLLIVYFTGIVFPQYYGVPNGAGEFGDMFGAANAIISGLALLLVVGAILLQMNELKLQREELTLTRDELRGQKELLASQNTVLGTQTFNNTFFHLLALHNSIVSDFSYVSDLNDQSDPERILKGTNGFDRMLDENFPEWKREDEKMEKALVIYDDLYFRFENNLSRYFRNLFHLIEYVHVSDVPVKRFYTNIVRAQLSNAEIVLLFYNGLHRNGREKFKPLIEMYGLLKNISRPEAYRKHQAYCESAFAGQDDK